MKPATEMYTDCRYESDYQPIIDAIGPTLTRADDDGYQGDTFLLLCGEGVKVGFVKIGWGSCSGCDALQSCKTFEEIDRLAQGIERDVQWFDDLATAKDWVRRHDWKGDFCNNQSTLDKFLERCAALP